MDQTPEYCLSPTCSALFQTRSMLQEITEQNDRLEAVNRDLNASRNDWKALAESKSARVAELEAELKSIADAKYTTWDDGYNTPQDFVAWVQNRCRFLLKR